MRRFIRCLGGNIVLMIMLMFSAVTKSLHLTPDHRLNPPQLGCDPLPWCAGRQRGWHALQAAAAAAAVTPATCSETSKATSAIFVEGGGVWDAKPAVPGQLELLLVPAVHVQQHVKGKGQEGKIKERNGTETSEKRTETSYELEVYPSVPLPSQSM